MSGFLYAELQVHNTFRLKKHQPHATKCLDLNAEQHCEVNYFPERQKIISCRKRGLKNPRKLIENFNKVLRIARDSEFSTKYSKTRQLIDMFIKYVLLSF